MSIAIKGIKNPEALPRALSESLKGSPGAFVDLLAGRASLVERKKLPSGDDEFSSLNLLRMPLLQWQINHHFLNLTGESQPVFSSNGQRAEINGAYDFSSSGPPTQRGAFKIEAVKDGEDWLVQNLTIVR